MKTNKLFKSDEDWEEYNSRLSKVDNKWLFYGEGYKLAIELLEKNVIETSRIDQDFLIYPYCFLIRHYVEIRLKEIIDEVNKIKGISVNSSKGGHNLSTLWINSQETLKNAWQNHFKEAPNKVSDFIDELNSIDAKSDSFRYPIDKIGQENLKGINEINFMSLAEEFQNVKKYLEGITDLIAINKENKSLQYDV